MDNDLYLKEKDLLNSWNDILTKEEVFWRHKSWELWLNEGDKNTKFFHNSTKIRRGGNKIFGLRMEDGSWIDKTSHIADATVHFF